MTWVTKKTVRDVLLILVISIVLAEIAFRIVDGISPLHIFYDDTYDRWRREPGTQDFDIKINAHGFRDTEFSPKRTGVYRIVALGDSMAYGAVPHRNNYLTILEQRMNARQPVEVLNMGIPNTGPRDYLSILVREGLAFDPDMVLVSVFIGNDILKPGVGQGKRELYTYSYLASFAHYLLHIRPQIADRQPGPDRGKEYLKYCGNCPRFEEDAFLKIESHRASIYFSAPKSIDPLVDRAFAPIAKMARLCEQLGIEFAVVLLPAEIQVYPALAKRVIDRSYNFTRHAAHWNPSLPNRLLGERLNARGIRFLDLLPEFSRVAPHETLYLPRDTHWNIAGNQLAGEAIYRYLSSLASG